MQRQFIYAYLGVLLLANILWAVIPRNSGELEQKGARQDWALDSPIERQLVDLQAVMQSGFWGQGDISSQASSGGSIKDIEQAEAKKLRAKVKAIIHRNGQVQVLFSDGKRSHRINKGEPLKGSDWILIDAGNDWLILQKQDSEGVQERLKLFSKVDIEKAPNKK